MGMDIVIQSLGIVFAVVGIVYLLKPNVMKWLMEFFKQGKRIYFSGVIRFVLAIVFFVGARECKHPWVIFAFGILFIIGGFLIFILKSEKIRRMLDWYQKQPVLLLRVIAVITLAVGTIIIYSA
ncbi:MAG: DUF2065 family protein [Planctomycetes bacterium]|nr:DUF2065 family protein [Planctomycetota bacterium]MCH8118129.1 DUF2065 family protein [Planctomycetota bacterium]